MAKISLLSVLHVDYRTSCRTRKVCPAFTSLDCVGSLVKHTGLSTKSWSGHSKNSVRRNPRWLLERYIPSLWGRYDVEASAIVSYHGILSAWSTVSCQPSTLFYLFWLGVTACWIDNRFALIFALGLPVGLALLFVIIALTRTALAFYRAKKVNLLPFHLVELNLHNL